jgi:hypothetical protein
MMDGLGWLSRPDKPHHPRDKRAEVIAAFSGVNCQRWGYERVNIRSLEWSTKAICSLLHVTCVENKVEPEEAIAILSARDPQYLNINSLLREYYYRYGKDGVSLSVLMSRHGGKPRYHIMYPTETPAPVPA